MRQGSRSTELCPACGYSLQGLEIPLCPECGLADVFAAAQAKRRKELRQIAIAFLLPAVFALGGSLTYELDRLDLAPGVIATRSFGLWITHLCSLWFIIGLVFTAVVCVRNIILPSKVQLSLKIAAIVPLGLFSAALLVGMLHFLGMAMGLWGL